MKKKVLSVILATVIMTSTLAACGSDVNTNTVPKADSEEAKENTPDPEISEDGNGNVETVTLRLWGGVPPEAGPQASCDLFNEQYKDKGIQVEYERFVNDDTGNMKLETNLLSGTGVDLYMSYTPDHLAKRASGDMALDLTELMEKDGFDLESYVGDMAEAYYVDGKPYSLPTKSDKYGIVINKDMFDEAGIAIPTEWTYEEFREIARQLTHGEGQDRVYGMFWNSQQDLTYALQYLSTQTLGGDPMYKTENETRFSDPVNIASVGLIRDMMLEDKTSPTHTDSVTQKLSQEGMFLTGKAAMTIGPWMVRSIKDMENYPHDFVTAFAPYPVVEKGQRNYTQGGYGDHLCINPKSQNVEAAWEFAKWYATQGMLPVAEGGRVPSFKTYDPQEVTNAFLKGGEELLDAETTKKVLIEPANNYAVPTITNHIPEIKKIFTEEMEKLLLGNVTVEEAMGNADERSHEILN
ncbi:ABC transporter substrate-binding protein [Kineothrix sp. MB12-C1]|uniref:ABC transporter substrate-binding protein n=1 Tax=Kineothrix sp. MB12-C1 TaxID=3070215 RepID=UPI0027D2759C|nr:sugar ABC transporter substrate-binding protein [Kineothrix sp. MB12-C1]WMC92364.1 sugar ABC transporter substrate-binding protein [Kineothrix sp. MB12-C1]